MNITLNFDGSSSPKKRDKAGCGYVLKFDDGAQYSNHELHSGEKSNNEMEYQGLINGLEKAIELGVENLTIRGDSQLIIRQVTGMYRVKKDTLIPLHRKVLELLKKVPLWSIEWIPRAQNEDADKASRST